MVLAVKHWCYTRREQARVKRLPGADALIDRFAGRRSLFAIAMASLAIVLDASAQSPPFGDTLLSWETALGPGSARVPALAEAGGGDTTLGLSRLIAVVLPASEPREILFVGVAIPGEPLLDPDDLYDAFVLGYRVSDADRQLGVTIEPTADQVRLGLADGDLMQVLYLGGVECTSYGAAAFESDRLMKSLSLGIDNRDGTTFGSHVEGYQTTLARIRRLGLGGQQSWKRHWIEQLPSPVRVSADGRTVFVVSAEEEGQLHRAARGELAPAQLANSRLRVFAQYMERRDGKLVPRDPDKIDEDDDGFAAHLSQRLFEFGREFPAFLRLHAYAQAHCAAQTVFPLQLVADEARKKRSAVSKEGGGIAYEDVPRPELDHEWFMERYEVRPRKTDTETPARIATDGERSLRGGVDARPKLIYLRGGEAVRVMQDAVLGAWPKHRGRDHWPVDVERRRFTVGTGPRPSLRSIAPRVQQVDARIGPLDLVRSYGDEPVGLRVGRGWTLHVPGVRFAKRSETFMDRSVRPRAAYVDVEPGRVEALEASGRSSLPSGGSTTAYFATDETRRLLLYRNLWRYEEGEVQWLQDPRNGSIDFSVGPRGRAIQFSGDEDHRVEWIRTDRGSIEFHYEGGLLRRIDAAEGQQCTLYYDTHGYVSDVCVSDGRALTYHRTRDHLLTTVVDQQGHGIGYRYEGGRGTLNGLEAEFGGEPASSVTHPRLLVTPIQRRRVPAVPATPRTAFVHLDYAPARSGRALDVAVRTDRESTRAGFGRDLSANVEDVLDLGANGPHAERLRQQILGLDGLREAERVVLLGPHALGRDLARALRLIAPAKIVLTAADAQRATRNVTRLADPRGGTRLLVEEAGMQPETAGTFREAAGSKGDTAADVVLVVGHNHAALNAAIGRWGHDGAFRDKAVVLFTCGDGELPGAVEDLFARHGARQVIAFREPIDQRAVTAIVERLQEALRQEQPGSALAERLRSAAEAAVREFEARRDATTDSTKREELQEAIRNLRVLLRFDDEIGRAPTVVPATWRTAA